MITCESNIHLTKTHCSFPYFLLSSLVMNSSSKHITQKKLKKLKNCTPLKT